MSDDKVKEVSKDIYQFKGISNFYLVLGSEVFLVDTGMPGRTKELEKYLKKLDMAPGDVKTIVITHHHQDHTGSLDKMKNLTGARVAIHKEDAEYVSEEKKQPGPLFMKPFMALIKVIYNVKPVKADILLVEGDNVGDYKVIHAPGHTPGSICLYNPDKKVLFAGDNIKYSDGKLESPTGRLLPDPEKYKESMKKIGELDIETILTGHGEPVTSGANKLLDEFIEKLT
jgi:hydroxyacylglutathione hydrolase